MKSKQHEMTRMYPSADWRRILPIATLAATVLLSACGGGSDGGAPSLIDIGNEGGIIGTGVEGTVTTKRVFAQSDVQIKSQSGEVVSAAIADNGRFSATDLAGTGPYLMRVDLGNDNSYFAIAHGTENITQNIHAFSDVAIRNWFATNGADVESAFNSSGAIAQLPTAAQINEINASIRSLIESSLETYGLGGVDLQTVSFDADNTGIDRFLDRNTVLVTNGSITIIIQDDGTDTIGTVSNDLPINTDLTSADVIPPSAPTNLRVLPSASNEIVLAWDSATDNIGVTSYQVFRDGVVIATTPYPVLIDTNLAANTLFSYTIAAIDAAGNVSTPSASGSSQTLAAPDTTPPPSPAAVELTPTNASISVRWTQADVADVAAFRILRSEGSSMIDSLARVTSTGFFDVDLNSGVEYCYQVTAIDASENESAPTAVTCASTTGSVISTAQTPPTQTPPTTTTPNNPSQSNNATYLLALDASSTACTNIVDFTSVDSSATLSGQCFLVNNSITVQSGGSLSIAAGTVLKFAAGEGITVREGGSLTAAGTTSNPIILTGQDLTPGYWDGLTFSFSNSTSNRLENVLIEYGGSTANKAAAVSIVANTSFISRVAMTNVALRHSASDGFYVDQGAIIDVFDSVISTNNERSGSVSPELAASLPPAGLYTGNTIDIVHVQDGDIDKMTEWPLLDAPWSVGSIDVEAPLSISPGSTLLFRSGGDIGVSADGSFKAVGTAAMPILLTSSEPTPGFWDGLNYRFSGSANNQLEHVTIEYGGGGSSSGANLTTTSNTSFTVRLSMNNVTLRNGIGPGFNFNSGTSMSEFSNITVTGNDSAAIMHPSQLSDFGSNLDFIGNGIDEILLLRATVATSQTWPAANVPYRFNDITVNAPLTLSAGTVMLANPGSNISVSSDGSFNAVGTPAAPISLIGGQRNPGHWEGIDFVFSNSPQNVLDNVILSDAGAGNVVNSGNVGLNCNGSFPAQVTIQNSTISNSASWGVFRNNEACAVNIGANVTFSNNAQGDINTL